MIRNEFDKAFVFDSNRELIVDEKQIAASKKFIGRWNWLIQLLFGFDSSTLEPEFVDQTNHPANRSEMIRLHGLGHVLNLRCEQLRNFDHA